MPQEYFKGLTSEQKQNIALLIKRMRDKGINNIYAQSGILSVISKESSFIPQWEKSYKNTNNADIRKVFGERLAKYTEAELSVLKKDDFAFFEAVYGCTTKVGQQNGNNLPGDGYKHRGAGYNQETFKNNHKVTGQDIGVDLENHPEKLNEVPVATDAVIASYVRRFKKAPSERLSHYKTNGLNGFLDLTTAVKACYHANAGWGKDYAKLENPDGTSINKGRTRALDRAPGFLEMVQKYPNI